MNKLIDFMASFERFVWTKKGPEMTCDEFVSWAEGHGIQLRYIQTGKTIHSAYVERFDKSVRTEVLNAW